MTRKMLARDSGVSERYLAQLETGQGNISILLLRQIANALDIPVEASGARRPRAARRPGAHDRVPAPSAGGGTGRSSPPAGAAFRRSRSGGAARPHRTDRFARRRANPRWEPCSRGRLEVPFIELDRLIEQESGVGLSAIFDLYGQSGFRRLERRCLDQVIERHPRFVLATGGSLVSEPATFERLLTMCFTVWLRATPEEHMQRVIAQGDMRPMADNRESMSDLKRILEVREPLYRKADVTVETSGLTVRESAAELTEIDAEKLISLSY